MTLVGDPWRPKLVRASLKVARKEGKGYQEELVFQTINVPGDRSCLYSAAAACIGLDPSILRQRVIDEARRRGSEAGEAGEAEEGRWDLLC